MRGQSNDRSGRSTFILLALLASIWLCPTRSRADDNAINDPKAWADKLAKIVSTRDTDKIVNALTGAFITKPDPDAMRVKLAQVFEVLARSGNISSIDPMTERAWGKSIVMYWYYLDFKNKPAVISVRLKKHADAWQLDTFNFNTDFDDAKLP